VAVSDAGTPPPYCGTVDQPFVPADPALLDVLDGAIDAEGKIGRALASLGAVDGRDVLLLDDDRGLRRAQLTALGARVKAIAGPDLAGPDLASLDALPAASVDALVAFWTGLGLGPAADPATLAALSRVVRPEGRILFIEAYGRDDTSHLFGDTARETRLAAANDRRGPMLAAGFRVRVLHCWWTFADLEVMTAALGGLFPATGATVAATLRRPRVSFKVAVYHRSVEQP
jgi:hypothetical protein